MTVDEIIPGVLSAYAGTVLDRDWGERGIFYNPVRALPKGIYLMTCKESNGPHDKASDLDRDRVFRLNIGISKHSCQRRFGALPFRPSAAGIVDTGHDFARLDEVMPHPVYGWMGWICVLNPSRATFDDLRPLIDESYQLALEKFGKRMTGR